MLATFFGRTAPVCGFMGEAVLYHLPHNMAVVNPHDSLRFGFLVQEILLFFPQVSEDYFVWSFPDRVHHTVLVMEHVEDYGHFPCHSPPGANALLGGQVLRLELGSLAGSRSFPHVGLVYQSGCTRSQHCRCKPSTCLYGSALRAFLLELTRRFSAKVMDR